jgi:hypothetical protein
MNEGDGARLCGVLAAGFRAARVEAEHSAYEQTEHRDHPRMVVGEAIAKCVRKAQHPLANGDAREDAIYAVGRQLFECVLDEAGDTIVLAGLVQKRWQVALYDLVQDSLSRVASRVGVTRWAWRGSSPCGRRDRHAGCYAAPAPGGCLRGFA